MRRRKIGGCTCPQCHQYSSLLTGDVLGEHRTDLYALGSNRKERCPYSGGTWADAKAGISPLQRRTEAYQARKGDRS